MTTTTTKIQFLTMNVGPKIQKFKHKKKHYNDSH